MHAAECAFTSVLLVLPPEITAYTAGWPNKRDSVVISETFGDIQSFLSCCLLQTMTCVISQFMSRFC